MENQNKDELSKETIMKMWKGIYFSTQAGMERYLVSNYGYGAILEWIDKIGEASLAQGDRYKTEGTIPFVENQSIVSKCWESKEVKINKLTKEQSELEINGCGILEYREKARERGIPITFDDPCREYCTKLLCKMAEKQGLKPTFKLKNKGCIWNVIKEKY